MSCCWRWRLPLLLLGFRVFNALFLATSFDPDEFWQSVEGGGVARALRGVRLSPSPMRCSRARSPVAHRLVFGFGYLTWEWEPSVALRSFVHPSLFAALFQALKATSLDSTLAVVNKRAQRQQNTHRLARSQSHAIVAKIAVVGAQAGASELGGRHRLAHLSLDASALWLGHCVAFGRATDARWAPLGRSALTDRRPQLILSTCNWFLFYCLPRTYSNCLETTLLLAAFLCWPRVEQLAATSRAAVASLALAALACLVRPTAAVYVAPLAACSLAACLKSSAAASAAAARRLVGSALCVGALALLLGVLVDSVGYDRIANDAAVRRVLAADGGARPAFRWRSSLLNFLDVRSGSRATASTDGRRGAVQPALRRQRLLRRASGALVFDERAADTVQHVCASMRDDRRRCCC